MGLYLKEFNRRGTMTSKDGIIYNIFSTMENNEVYYVITPSDFPGDSPLLTMNEALEMEISLQIYGNENILQLESKEVIDSEEIEIMPADEFDEEYKYNKVTGKIIIDNE